MPRNRGAANGPEDEFGFEGWSESEELSPADQLLVESLVVPVPRRSPSQAAEVALDFRRRLEELKVENPGKVSRWTVRQLPKELYLIPYALEDVHYSVYENRRNRSPSPYLSISFEDVINATPSDVSQMQREQTLSSYLFLTDRGLKENRLYRWAISEQLPGEETYQPEHKFAIRCLARLLREKPIKSFSEKLPNESYERGADRPLVFEDVAQRASILLERSIQNHQSIDVSRDGIDARTWYFMEMRELERARSFARPLGGLILKNVLENK